MALTDVVFMSGNSASAARGDIGTLTDILPGLLSHRLLLVVPLVGQVQSGVAYGQQGTELTGTFVGGGGAGMSRSRVANT